MLTCEGCLTKVNRLTNYSSWMLCDKCYAKVRAGYKLGRRRPSKQVPTLQAGGAMSKQKLYQVRVSGQVLHTPVVDQIADMLRYDRGVLVSVKETPIEGKAWNRFEAIVHSVTYTEARWDSFMLKTELIRRV